ncbi:MAG: hypothetical protein IJ828_08000 [Treponema sp.]|nr:hypothetical protein [Treponema sp.]
MKRILPFLCMLFLFAPVVHAQEYYDDEDYYNDDDYYEEDSDDDYYDDNDDYYDEDQKEHEENDEISYIINKTRAGDQCIKISLAVDFPTNFGNPLPTKDGKLKMGGIGTLGYKYFLKDWFAVGADVGFGFNSTIGGNTFNWIPIVVSATVQPSVKNFEFPISMGIGMAYESYNSKSYWPGLVIKPEVGVHYKINQGWSVGCDVSYTILPQLGKTWDTGSKNIYGKFIMVAACARYYF